MRSRFLKVKTNKLFPGFVALVVAAYFLYFAIPALRAHFAADDMMNMGKCWLRGFPGTLLDNLEFWSAAYRPTGCLFYLPIYHGLGMNPLPYRIAVLLLIAANIWLSYGVAELLTD